jgi:hypothetical protein
VMDPTYINHEAHPVHDWVDFYNCKELIPPDMPEPRGKPVQTTGYADSDHARDLVSRRSRTGVLLFCNHSPIASHSKKQGSIETLTFGSEFMAMKTVIELVEGPHYELRIMGCPIDGPMYIKPRLTTCQWSTVAAPRSLF